MSSYHTSFEYLNKNSYDDFNLQIVHFDGGDSGEVDSYLSQEAIYTDSPRGTKRTIYGTKYNSVATLQITVMRPDGAEFGIEKTREINRWLTGSNQYSWMDLYVGEEVKYRMHCFVQDVKPYKLDSRIVGFVITAESSSPWCYSSPQTISQTVTGNETLQIDNLSDDLYTYTDVRTVFENSTGKSLTIKNKTIDEETTVNNLVDNEVITLSENMFITSDKTSRVFGNNFNYVWPKLASGVNEFEISGTGTITFEYIYAMKVVDCVGDLNAASDPVCNESGDIILDTLSWHRIIDTPTTLSGYGITNAYTKTEIDTKIASVTVDDVYTKAEIDEMFSNISIDDVYTKPEVDEKIAVLESQIADLLYKDIVITSLSNDAGTKEKGMVVDVTVKWTTSREPKAITLGGVSLNTTDNSYTYRSISSNKSWTLVVTGERGEKATRSTSVAFYNGVYYGVSAEPSTYDSNFILSLPKTLSSNKVSSFTATAGEGQYIYYCLPTSMGTCSFSVGGFTGGITLVDTIEFVNQYGHKEQYYIYRSDYPNLGTRNVLVS